MTKLILDAEYKLERGYGRQVLGLGSESDTINNRRYLESYQGIFGNKNKGKVGIGTYNGKPSLQGFGTGSSYNFITNPKLGNHISAPNGITEMSGVKFGTVLTSSNFTTNKTTRTILLNTNDGRRFVQISPSEEKIRRELVIKNIGFNDNILEIKSASAMIDEKKIIQLKDNEALTIVFDGISWQITSKYAPSQ